MTQLQSHLKRLQTHFKSEPGLILARDLEASFTIKHYGKVITINKDPTDLDLEVFDSSSDYRIIDNLQSKQIANDDDESDDDADVSNQFKRLKTGDVATESVPPQQPPQTLASNNGVGPSNYDLLSSIVQQPPQTLASNNGIGRSKDPRVSILQQPARGLTSNKGVGRSKDPRVPTLQQSARGSTSNKDVGRSNDRVPILQQLDQFLASNPPLQPLPVQALTSNTDLKPPNDLMDLN
jgi:hypothetical protein